MALALIGDPEVVFLDEPTTGFDPAARRTAWDVIGGLRRLGKTVFLTTHYMEEAEFLADRIAVLARGQIVAEGTPTTLGGRDHMTATIRFTLPRPDWVARLAGRLAGNRVSRWRRADGAAQHRRRSSHLRSLANWALDRGFDLPDIDVRRPTLEEVYLSLTTANGVEPR